MSTTPIGGSTGCDHQDNPAIDEAATWLAAQEGGVHPVVPTLRRRFGLTTMEAVEAIKGAGERNRRGLS